MDISIQKAPNGISAFTWHYTSNPEIIYFSPIDDSTLIDKLEENPELKIKNVNRYSGMIKILVFTDLLMNEITHETIHMVVNKFDEINIYISNSGIDYFQSKGVLP